MSGALPVLYSFRRCPYAMRARLALAVSGARVEHREITLKNKPAEMLAASPKGTVPVLVLPGGDVIEESLDVMLWALRRNDPEQWLTPAQGSIDDMLALVAGNDGAFKRSLDRYKYPNRYAEESAGDANAFAQQQRALGAAWLHKLDGMLEGGWLFGARASLADMALLPFVRQFVHTDPAWFAAQPWPRLQAWLAQFEASALYTGVMEKHAPWQASVV
ncbi:MULTISPECIES: glutathione S-transferase [unclassified Polaromonas]|uniref:glutathione S-transferase n=1 Tax=unclassified Polaromonas TaxID=2638319 RepID=UPI000F0961AA|nr:MULTISPECIES: glutathione S-transferase [unclassified Polaromonas]AYQ29648.1 glutathione S-transferase [Polaromonas sp. SP1]QGJ19238.1 glutathione S-transferase [Polaromonas sp. Pch-P]